MNVCCTNLTSLQGWKQSREIHLSHIFLRKMTVIIEYLDNSKKFSYIILHSKQFTVRRTVYEN